MSDRRSPEEIEHAIEETREKLADDIEALKARVSPTGLKQEAAQRLEDLSEAAAASAKDVAVALTERAEAAGDSLLERLRATPFPLTALGAAFALGYLLMRSSRREPQAPTAYRAVERARAQKRDRSALLWAGAALAGGVAAGWLASGSRRGLERREPVGELPPPAPDERRAVEALFQAAVTPRSDDAFRQHYQASLAASGRPFDFYAHAYRYGASLRESDGHDFASWQAMEPYARRAWEGSNQTPWDEVMPAVRHGWEREATGERPSSSTPPR